jgi:hypothetical protein
MGDDMTKTIDTEACGTGERTYAFGPKRFPLRSVALAASADDDSRRAEIALLSALAHRQEEETP